MDITSAYEGISAILTKYLNGGAHERMMFVDRITITHNECQAHIELPLSVFATGGPLNRESIRCPVCGHYLDDSLPRSITQAATGIAGIRANNCGASDGAGGHAPGSWSISISLD